MKRNLHLLALLLLDNLEPHSNGTSSHRKPISDQILKILQAEPGLLPAEIRDRLGAKPEAKNRLSNRLHHLLHRLKYVTRDDSGRYRLNSAGRKYLAVRALRDEIETEGKQKKARGRKSKERVGAGRRVS